MHAMNTVARRIVDIVKTITIFTPVSSHSPAVEPTVLESKRKLSNETER